jgi:hypothetical protein
MKGGAAHDSNAGREKMSRLTNCPDCGAEISQKAKACPHCSRARNGGFFVKLLGFVARLVIAIIALPFLPVVFAGFGAGFHHGAVGDRSAIASPTPAMRQIGR